MPNYEYYPASNSQLIQELSLLTHPEGGYYIETDRQTDQIPSPYANNQLRSLSTTIYYFLTYNNPRGVFHMNKSTTVHVLHHGRSEYTLITPSPIAGQPPKIEVKVMGTDVSAGETRQLIVGGGVWKMSQLPKADMEKAEGGGEEVRERTGCLITEVVMPGFHWEDHAFLTREGLGALFEGVEGGAERVKEYETYVKKT